MYARGTPAAACLFLLALVGPLSAQEWTRFRGPNGAGVSDSALPVRWTEKDYHWKVTLPGVGHSSPVLWGGRLFITSGEEATGKRLVLCLRAADGEQLWMRQRAGVRHGKHADNSFASATPAVDERHVYVCWGSPKDFLVLALDHDGKEVWRTDLGPFQAGHGFGASPIVHEDLLIVPNEQDGQSCIVALECATGKVRWKVPRRSKSGYATPCVHRPQGKPAEIIVTSWEHGITALDAKTGQPAWEMDIFSKGHVESAIASPVVAGDLVLGTCGWLGVRYEVVAVRPYPAPKEGPRRPAYRIEKTSPLVPTPLVKDDLLFLWTDRGVVTCIDVRSGEKYWSERVPGAYYGSPVCAGKHLYCISREGDVIVLAAARRFQLLANNPLGEGSHSTPAIADGRMYLRTFSHLICVGGKSALGQAP
jgi:outer membrane protein assembly factor BamB